MSNQIQKQQQDRSLSVQTSSTKRNSLSIGLATCLFALLLISACSASTAQPIPTRAPAPTFTPTIEEQPVQVDPALKATAEAAAAELAAQQAAAQATQPPQAEATAAGGDQPAPAQEQPTPTTEPATNTPAPANPEVLITNGINVRQGPGTNYPVIGAANAGQRFAVTAKNQSGDWWQINFNGQTGWVFGQLVTTQNVQAVALAQNIPAPPPPTNTPVPPPPANTPAPVAQAPTAAPAPQNNFPFILLNTDKCEPNAGSTYMNGFVRYKSNAPRNGACVHMAFYGPRTTKCSGCDGVGDGNWGFSPFGGPAPAGTTVEIFMVACSGTLPLGGQNSGFGDLTPQSPKWTHTFNSSEQCTGITFVGD